MADGLTAPRIEYRSGSYDVFIEPQENEWTFSCEIWRDGSLMCKTDNFNGRFHAQRWGWHVITEDIMDDAHQKLYPQKGLTAKQYLSTNPVSEFPEPETAI